MKKLSVVKKIKVWMLVLVLITASTLMYGCKGAKEEETKAVVEKNTTKGNMENETSSEKKTTEGESHVEDQTSSDEKTEDTKETSGEESGESTKNEQQSSEESTTPMDGTTSSSDSTTAPTVAPTTTPTTAPTVAPTTTPTTAPTVAPTTAPTVVPDVNYGPVINKGTYNLEIYSKRNYEREAAKTKAETIINGIIKETMSYPERIKAIHDWLVVNVNYDYDVLNNINNYTGQEAQFSAYGALVNNWAVCEGYSEAFLYLCWTAGIEARLVEGEATNDSGTVDHEWNVVKLDGNWYQIDVTWDDPMFNGVANDPTGSNLMYRYCLITTADMTKNHKIENWYSLDGSLGEVACTSTTYYDMVLAWTIESKVGNMPYTFVSNYDEVKKVALEYMKKDVRKFVVICKVGTLDYNLVKDNVQSVWGAYLGSIKHPLGVVSYGYGIGITSLDDSGHSFATITLTIEYKYQE